MDLKQIFESEDRFQYMLLDRMRSDCEYYFGNGRIYGNHLWAGDEKGQIYYMKAIWNHFTDDNKPEWLTMDQILDYEKRMVDVVRQKPFMERIGSQQDFIYNYWFEHSDEIKDSVWDYLCMTLQEYDLWRHGQLKLNDGSYHEMEPSVFHLPAFAVDMIRNELVEPQHKSELSFSNSLNSLLPDDKHCFVAIVPALNDNVKLAYIYDGGDDVLAVVSKNEILYKEDFADMMKASGMEATEINFDKVWSTIRSGYLSDVSLKDGIMADIQGKKPSLNVQINSAAGLKTVKVDSKEKIEIEK